MTTMTHDCKGANEAQEESKPRYIVTEPIPHGYQWWKVADTQSEVMPNFEVAMFAAHIPFAGEEARRFCEKLNRAYDGSAG